jgi:hypothetical protein
MNIKYGKKGCSGVELTRTFRHDNYHTSYSKSATYNIMDTGKRVYFLFRVIPKQLRRN